MSIKDIFDTPIDELWSIISGFVSGYLLFPTVFFIIVASFIIYVASDVFKRHRDFIKQRKKNSIKRK